MIFFLDNTHTFFSYGKEKAETQVAVTRSIDYFIKSDCIQATVQKCEPSGDYRTCDFGDGGEHWSGSGVLQGEG